MKPTFLAAAIASTVIALATSAGAAQSIERACLQSGSPASSRALCGCIQDAANLTLAPAEQKLAASFFRDPAKAEEIRQSTRRTHRKFWERYKAYVETAGTFCR